ncbi:MAG: hypothetical protein AXW12_13275 [Thalassospira sp. Nap_22]|nr:MAG: hypothetical protein AXW12_13275 [Thalassospira sp. Nap_22]
MAITLQFLYPFGAGDRFDYDYYLGEHLKTLKDCVGSEISAMYVIKGVSGGRDDPPYYAITTMEFASKQNLDNAVEHLGPVLENTWKFTNVKTQTLIGETVG